MKSSQDLQNLLRQIDHKGYPAYKDTRGAYQFDRYILSIDHVQGDPFAAPSHVSVHISGKAAGFAPELYAKAHQRIALQDHLLRRMAGVIRDYSFKARGSGKSGLIGVSQPGQEVLERSACVIDPANGSLILRMEIGFPANGRTINSRELEKILFDFLPTCVRRTLYSGAYPKGELERIAYLAEDQEFIREELKRRGLVAFVANGAILPRKSGVSMLPMKDAIPFKAPKSMEVTLQLPHHGPLTGMGIKKGITLIVGGGYHGKSTLLKALELGVYNHISGDGREYVITDETAMKLRAEDGRSIQKTDISMFIRNLPNGRDTIAFYTEDASGSTSQAANTVEAMEAGAKTFLIDEDTSATNFMIRDELMQRVVHRSEEPIIPFIDRVQELYHTYEISTILVAGSCGSYFHKADCVIQMKNYVPVEITETAKREAASFPMKEQDLQPADPPLFARVVRRDTAFAKEQRIKTKTMGKDGFSVNRENVDLRLVEQLADSEQLNALADMVKCMKLQYFDGKRTVSQGTEQFWNMVKKQGFAAFCGKEIPGNLCMPRVQELYATLNRCRTLLKVE
ncbi:MAG: ABC-ATPase domain-containing protein [Eubacteriales bacterium]|nr:ABC-ATPase domain-containing protein [Eubacteriales bacterium]